MEPILQLNDISVQFDASIQRINALDNVSLYVNKAEIVGIIGASGSGKSTLAKTILGLMSKNQTIQGHMSWVDGAQKIDILNQSKTELQTFRGRAVTMVFQNPLLNLNPSANIQAHFDRVLTLRNEKDPEGKTSDALQQVDLEKDKQNILSSYPHQLSGGQQQRILIALAVCQQVQLLVLDEPMSSLDKINQDAIALILNKLVQEQQLSIIIISHDLHVIELLSDRIYVLNEGRIVEEGATRSIISNPSDDYTKALISARMLGSKRATENNQGVIIKVEGLSHAFQKGGFLTFNKSKVIALKEVGLSIKKGSITGIVGPSGSGKSTLVKILLGVEEIQRGRITLDGRDISGYDQKSMSCLIQMIPQNTADALNPRMLLTDQLREVYRQHYSANMDGFDKVIPSLLKDVELDKGLLHRYPSELSGGEIQRMAIVRALLVRPQIMILDESLSALDMLIQKKTIDLIITLNRKLKMTIILISHDDRLIRHCCDDIVHLDHGRVLSV